MDSPAGTRVFGASGGSVVAKFFYLTNLILIRSKLTGSVVKNDGITGGRSAEMESVTDQYENDR